MNDIYLFNKKEDIKTGVLKNISDSESRTDYIKSYTQR